MTHPAPNEFCQWFHDVFSPGQIVDNYSMIRGGTDLPMEGTMSMGEHPDLTRDELVMAEVDQKIAEMKDTKGTPTTLMGAIQNACEEGSYLGAGPSKEYQKRIHAHVRDYLAQKFNVAAFDAGGDHNWSSGELLELFKKIVNEDQ